MQPGVRADLRTLFGTLSASRKRQLLLVLLLMPMSALAEMLMVAAVVPFLALLAGRTGVAFSIPIIPDLLQYLSQLIVGGPLVGSAILFALSALLSAMLRLLLNFVSQHFAYGVQHELVVEAQHRLLHQPYLFHVSRHSSHMMSALEKIDHLTHDLVAQGLQAISSTLIALFVLAILFSLDATSAALAALLVAGLYLIALLAVRQRVAGNAAVIGSSHERRIRAVQENLAGIRDIIIDRSQAAHLKIFKAVDRQFMEARAEIAVLSTAPRFLVEAIGLMLIAVIALFVVARPGGLPAALPVLGALALGAQRLLPLATQIYRGWVSLVSSRPMLAEVAELLRLPNEQAGSQGTASILLTDSVRLERVSFAYPGRDRPALHDVGLTIPRGSRVAITGRTGSGKSTLADLLMGLIEPSEGRISVDGVPLSGERLAGWRQSIAHVPQAIFLADSSIAANIALSRPGAEPDMERVRQAAAMAQLADFIETLPEGYRTRVGERGIRLSGGQRQRLGLARAVYKRAPLLVLDEATSALDDSTEAAVLAALDRLHAEGCTIVIIAHRLSTVARCNPIFVFDDGALVQTGTYDELFGQLARLEREGEL